MASARDNDIVIECSPYSDSETEIKNLKSMSYELIPTIGDIFTTSDSVSNFVFTFSLAGGLLVTFLLILYVTNNIKQSSDGELMTTSLNVLYFVLFIIGIIISNSNSENDEKMLTPVYIAFSVSILLVIVINIKTLYDKLKQNGNGNGNDKIDYIKLTNIILPFLGSATTSYYVNIGFSLAVIVIIYCVISFIRLANQIKSDWKKAFSPIVLLGSYCFLQVFKYLYSKLREISKTEEQIK